MSCDVTLPCARTFAQFPRPLALRWHLSSCLRGPAPVVFVSRAALAIGGPAPVARGSRKTLIDPQSRMTIAAVTSYEGTSGLGGRRRGVTEEVMRSMIVAIGLAALAVGGSSSLPRPRRAKWAARSARKCGTPPRASAWPASTPRRREKGQEAGVGFCRARPPSRERPSPAVTASGCGRPRSPAPCPAARRARKSRRAPGRRSRPRSTRMTPPCAATTTSRSTSPSQAATRSDRAR